jgi:hypothetical protein
MSAVNIFSTIPHFRRVDMNIVSGRLLIILYIRFVPIDPA